MRQKTKKRTKTMLCTMLAIALLFSGADVFAVRAFAAEDVSATKNVDVLQVELMDMHEVKPTGGTAKTVLSNCTIYYTQSAAGLHVEITTGCANGTASYLGVKDIKIEKKVWYGWQTIATAAGAQQSNCSITGLQFNYANVTVGETYRISCVHYGDYNGYHELSSQTSAFVFSY